MLLTSQTAQGLPPLRGRATTSNVVHCRQTRAFRFGMWPSRLDSAYHRELQRHLTTLKRKHLDRINGRLSWQEHPLAEDPRLALKRAAARFWNPTAARCSSRWANQDDVNDQKTASSHSKRPASPFDAGLQSPNPWSSHYNNIVAPFLHRVSPDTAYRSDAPVWPEHTHANAAAENPAPLEAMPRATDTAVEQDYVIDPITNRKVPKRDENNEPTPTFKAYRSQFVPFAIPDPNPERPPVYSNGKPPEAELDKYAESKLDDWAAPASSSSPDSTEPAAHPEAASYMFDSSALKNEEYALNHLPLDDPVDEYDDLDKYRAVAPDESLSSSSDDLEHPSLQPDSKSEQLQTELNNYGPYMHDEDSLVDPDSKESQDLEQYRHHVPDVSESTTKPFPVYNDLDKYEPRVFDEATDEDRLFEQYGDLEEYKKFRTQHLDTTTAPEHDTVAESLREYETKEEGREIPESTENNVHGAPFKIPKMTLPDGHIFSTHHSSHNRADNTNFDNGTKHDKLRKLMDELNESFDSIDGEISSNISKSRRNSKQDSSAARNVEENSQDVSGATQNVATQPTLDNLCNIARLEPILGRHTSTIKGNRFNRASGGDFYSKEPQGLETSFSEECGGRQTMPLYTRTYGSEPGQVTSRTKPGTVNESQEIPERPPDTYYHRDPEIDGIPPSELTDAARNQTKPQPDEPTVYKILAYDPSTQSINVAETSSGVPDSAPPLSPTEVLPRLSHPTKFFPYFASLQAEGFEIVSGDGNVLVFRQMRPAKAAVPGGTTYVNPIDMMGRSAAVPSAAAFVSPTGFINYDIPGVGEELADGTSQADARSRREGSTSIDDEKGPSSGDKSGNEKKLKVGKRIIIGGVWVAGVSYAIGVVSEYFSTGGTDGQGPKGFSPS